MNNIIPGILLFLLSIIYLGLGWYLLNPDTSRRFDFGIFFFGYSFSSVHMALFFRMKDYPLSTEVAYGAMILLLAALLLLVISRSKRLKKYLEVILYAVIMLVLIGVSMVV